MSIVKAENIRLKERVEELETRLLGLVGAFKVFAGGMPGKEQEMNRNISEIITGAGELKIVAPYVTEEYAMLLQDRAKSGVKIQLVLNDRRFWPKEYQNIYDNIKATSKIDIINNPNVKFLLVWTPETALFTSGPLCKNTLAKTILIGTLVKEDGKLKEVLKIFNLMLPSFMRAP